MRKGRIPGYAPVLCANRRGRIKPMKEYYTVTELADHFGVNPKTIYRRLWAKEIPAFKVGNQWRIAKKDIIWLKR